jgi:hypothetical protein
VATRAPLFRRNSKPSVCSGRAALFSWAAHSCTVTGRWRTLIKTWGENSRNNEARQAFDLTGFQLPSLDHLAAHLPSTPHLISKNWPRRATTPAGPLPTLAYRAFTLATIGKRGMKSGRTEHKRKVFSEGKQNFIPISLY